MAIPAFEEVLPDIWLLRAPFSVVWTGVTLVRGERNFLIDSSADVPETWVLPALAQLGVKPEEIDWLLNTHSHGDHIGGHHALVSQFGMKTAVIEQGAQALADPVATAIRVRTKFPANSPPPQCYLKGVTPDRVLKENEVLDGRLFPIHTPGHDLDCVCWYDVPTKTIICGDSLQGNGTPTQGVGFYQSLAAYRRTLDHLATYDVENILCGHDYAGIGSLVRGRAAAQKALRTCRDFVDLYDARLRAYAQEIPPETTLAESDWAALAMRLIDEVGCGRPAKLFLALYTVTEHLKEIGR